MAQSARAVIIVADGDLEPARLVDLAGPADASASPGSPYVIAADGGAARVLAAGRRPDLVIGDGDSLGDADRTRLDELGVELRLAAADKDESDLELCLLAAIDAGASRITILGALGGQRPEHSIGNLLLLADPRLDGTDVAIVDAASRITRVGTRDGPGSISLRGAVGDYVSLFPLDARVSGIDTTGLRFALTDATLELGPTRGLSNELLGNDASVTTRRGRLLVIHTSHDRGG